METNKQQGTISRLSIAKLYGLGSFFLFIAFFCGFLRLELYPFEIKENLKIIPNSKISKLVCLDHDGFLADMLFIRITLHSGSLMWKPLSIKFNNTWAYSTMDVVTDLDPKFYKAYLLSSMGLVHSPKDINLAEPILQKGMKNFPDSWELPFWAGYGYYNYLKDYKKATNYMIMAYNKPDAPKRFLGMMASATQKSGNFDKAAIAMLAMMENTDNKKLKIIYGKKMIRMKNLAQIMTAAKKYINKFNHNPLSIQNLLDSGYLQKLPVDPLGATYKWDNKTNLPSI